MSNRRDNALLDTLSETRRLVGDLETPAGAEFSLESILAEFGQGEAEPALKREETPAAEGKAEEPAAPREPEEP